MGSFPINILDRATGLPVEAELLDLIAPEDLMVLEAMWTPERSRIVIEITRAGLAHEERPQSLSWNWRAKAQHLRLLQASGYAVVCSEEWQGAMLTKSGTHLSRLGEARGKPLVYIEFLEAAPWNWTIPGIGQKSRFGRVGWHLFRRAVYQSLFDGSNGRVGLHALAQAARFYSDVCGMIPLGTDEEHEDLEYFELSEAQAMYLLNGSD